MKYDFELDLNDDNSLGKIINQIEKNSIVLEFGPATGRMTKYLKEELQCEVYIVEIDSDSAKIASTYAKECIVGDIEEFQWLEKWKNIEFDYIIFADVLEHLRNPQTVLEKTRLLLKNEGSTFISVPNVAHNAIMINLFNNIFNYTPVGLLDNTHIHLFAYNTLVQFCNFAGYTPVVEDAVYSEVGENEVNAAYTQVNSFVEKELRNRIYGNVYQFVFTLKKTSYVKSVGNEIRKMIVPYSKGYRFQLFFDSGNGWCEENCVSIMYKMQQQQEFSIDFRGNEKIRKIRIDPIDCAVAIRIESIKLIINNQEMQVSNEMIQSNAKFQFENIYVFDQEDPYLILDQDHFSFDGLQSVNCVIRYLDNELQTLLETQLTQAEEELQRRAVELDNRMEVINEKQERIQTLEMKSNEKQERIQTLEMQLTQAEEELQRRAVELDNRMDVINDRDRKILNLEECLNEKDKMMIVLNEKNSGQEIHIKELESKIKEMSDTKYYKIYNKLFRKN